MADKKPSAKSKVEAVLFSVGHRISVENIARLCRILKEDAVIALKELQKEYDEKQSSLMLVDEGDHWKFTVRDHLIHVVRKIVTETELTKSVLETLAVIAFKYPILQADLIKIRTNKAYDHLVELEKAGYISRQKHSRTNLIKLTEKFFKYFDLTEEKLREQFKDFSSIAAAIAQKEVEVEKAIDDQKKRAEELKAQDEKIKEEIESLDEKGEDYEIPVETYAAKPENEGKETAESRNAESEKPKALFKPEEESEAKEILKEVEVVDVEAAKEQKSKKQNKKENTDGYAMQSSNAEQLLGQESKTPAENKNQNSSSNEAKEINGDIPKPRKKKKGIVLTPEQDKIAEQKAEAIIQGKNYSENSPKQGSEQK